MEHTDFQNSLTEPKRRSKASPVPQASPEHPKQRHTCAEQLLYLQRVEYQLQTQTETERLREKAAKKHQIRVRTTLGAGF